MLAIAPTGHYSWWFVGSLVEAFPQVLVAIVRYRPSGLDALEADRPGNLWAVWRPAEIEGFTAGFEGSGKDKDVVC